jgi:FkbM family methyltransferase
VLGKVRFDLVEMVMVAGVTGFLVWALKPSHVLPTPSAEIRPFAERYGPSRESENYEEWLIRDFFADRRNGTFVDVGANHPRRFSNTWYLETALGWSGIAVEPLTQFAAGYATDRPRTKFRAFFVSDVSDATAKMFVLDDNSLVSSQTREFTERYKGAAKEVAVPTITLTDLLVKEGLPTIDFLNMDIELAEPKALAGFDIKRFAPALVCIEAHPEVRQDIVDYFSANGYSLIAKYLRADQNNLYFTPARPKGTL